MRPIGGWSSSQTMPRKRIWSYFTGSGTANPTLKYTYDQVWSETVMKTGYNSGPGWRDRLAAGVLPPTPMSNTKTNLGVADADAYMAVYYRPSSSQPWERFPREVGQGVPYAHSLATSSLNATFGSKTASVQQQALASLYRKISGVNFDTYTFVGEAKETQTMLRSGATFLAKSILNHEGGLRDRIAKFKFSNLASLRDFAVDSWLGYQYGIQPLIGDVQNAIEAYAHADSLLEVKHLRGGAQGHFSTSYLVPVSAPYSGAQPDHNGKHLTVTCTDTRLVQVRCGVRAGTVLNHYGNPNWGLTWNNVLPAVWELIPYSFLIDYFSNVGDIIQAYTAPRAGLSHYWMTTSVEDIRKRASTRWDETYVNSRRVGYYIGGETRAFTVSRSTGSAPPLPSLSFSNWDSLSLTKQVSVGALLTRFVTRKSSSFGFLAKLLS